MLMETFARHNCLRKHIDEYNAMNIDSYIFIFSYITYMLIVNTNSIFVILCLFRVTLRH